MYKYDLSYPEIYAYANLWPLWVTENGGERYATTAELAVYTERYKQMCDDYITRAAQVYGPDSSISILKGYTINRSDEPEPQPSVAEYKDKEGTRNVNFKARSLTGEIIMSNYKRSYVKITRRPGMEFVNGSRRSVAIRCNEVDFSTDLGNRGISFWPGTRCSALRSTSAAFGHWRQSGDVIWRFPPLVDPEAFLSTILASKPDATQLVTSVSSEANRRALDILTSMAEMPETFKSVLSGFKNVVKLVKDVKKGDVAISKSFAKRKEYLTRKHQSDLAKLDNSRKGASKYKLILIERERKRISDSYSKAMKGLGDELASSLADLWLNFRYNIMPNVYLVEDIEKAYNQWGREWTTTRDREVETIPLPWYGHELSVEWTTRCLIKRLFEPNGLGNSAVLSANVFSTAWELVPLSFVVDWFINVGDILSSVTTPQGWKQEGCSLSQLCELHQEIKFSDDPKFSGVITFEIKSYDRRSINPIDYIGLVWQPDLSPVRQLDALALIWRPVRLLLSNLK